MFAKAVEIASRFTHVVVSSTATVGGKATSGCGSFVAVNDEGWILTAAHIFAPRQVLDTHRKAHAEFIAKKKEIEGRAGLSMNKKKKLIGRLEYKEDWLLAVSLWWESDAFVVKTAHMNLLADIAVAKIENYKAHPNATFPKFGNPAVVLPPGRSLCKTGFPFHSIESSYDETKKQFTFKPGSLPIPRFPLDGILTRYQITKDDANKSQAKFVEMSTPGLRGQSGGPIFDVNGVVWGIQVQTKHLPLGFQPEVSAEGKKVAEHQFLNVGLAAYVNEITALFDKDGVKYKLAA